MPAEEPTEAEKQFLAEMGLTEVEPGRWSTGWEADGPAAQAFLDGLTEADIEQLDLMAAANRVQNEFDLEQSGAGTTASMQLIGPSPNASHRMPVFVGIREDFVGAFEALKLSALESKADEVLDLFDGLMPPDILATALRKLGVKAKAIQDNPRQSEDWSSVAGSLPGFRIAVVYVPEYDWVWIDG